MAEAIVLKNAAVFWSTSTGSAAADQVPGVKSVSFPLSKNELPNSVMGDLAETFKQGLITAPISILCRQEFSTGAALGDGGMDKEAWTRWNSETAFRMKFRYVNSAVADDNPSYLFSRCGVFSHTPIDGAHGALLENKMEIRLLSGCTVTRSTST